VAQPPATQTQPGKTKPPNLLTLQVRAMLPVKVPLDPPVHGMLGKTAKGFSRIVARHISSFNPGSYSMFCDVKNNRYSSILLIGGAKVSHHLNTFQGGGQGRDMD